MVLSRGPDRQCSKHRVGHGLAFFVCVVFAAAVLGHPTPALEASFSELAERADKAFHERFLEGRMRDSIACYESLLDLDPLPVQSEAFVLRRLSQLCYELTTFSEGSTPEDRDLLFRGKDYGLRSLRLVSAFAEWEEDDFKKAVGSVSDPATLLWTAHNWGAYLSFVPLQGVLNVSAIITMYERCLAIDERYWGASAHSA